MVGGVIENVGVDIMMPALMVREIFRWAELRESGRKEGDIEN